ncbi:MAG: sarcosine oxidase subunit gamma family protein [Azospirillaceae bacterium]
MDTIVTVDPTEARRTPLADRPAPRPTGPEPAIRLAEIAHLGKLNLRGETGEDEAGDRSFMAAVGRVAGLVLPTDPMTVRAVEGVTALWLGPDEWLLTTPPGAEIDLKARLEEQLAGLHAAVVDVTDNTTIIRLSGPRSRDVLMTACPLDLHARAFGPGQVKESVFAHVDVILHLVEEPEGAGERGGAVFDLHVRRSFADYVWDRLEDAARPWGGAVAG